MRITSHCECPNCGPYARLVPTASIWRRVVAGLIHCFCFRCLDCGTRVLVRNEQSLVRRLLTGPMGLVSFLVVMWCVVSYPTSTTSARGTSDSIHSQDEQSQPATSVLASARQTGHQ